MCVFFVFLVVFLLSRVGMLEIHARVRVRVRVRVCAYPFAPFVREKVWWFPVSCAVVWGG